MDVAQPMYLLTKRVRIVYAIAAFETSLLILLVFMQPVYMKLVHGVWDRYGTQINPTLSLDVHVLFAIPFLLLVMLQIFLGFIQKPGHAANKLHRRLGSFLLLYTAVFLIITLWNLLVRIDYIVIQLGLFFIIVYVVFFMLRGYRAIKYKDYLKHVDSMMGVFVLSGIAANSRLIGAIYLLIYGHIPNLAFWSLISIAVIISKLLLIYALAGRLKQNILVCLMQVLPICLIYGLLPWPP